jgi:dihydroorotate dehydrogenase subfamily 2
MHGGVLEYDTSMNSFLVGTTGRVYRGAIKPVLFRFDPEAVHQKATALGQAMGKSRLVKRAITPIFRSDDASLAQELFGIPFKNPIGLAAGFDYEARLTQILPAMGFGFGTVGTLTNKAYGGNPRPMLGRLPRSRSLMVNKGFKNLGIAATLKNLEKLSFAYPVGVSIGKTNTLDITTQAEAVADVVAGFQAAEASPVAFSYYELNISCPNLMGSIDFYEPAHLTELLDGIAPLRIARPIFVKMPISKTDGEIRAIMDVIVRYPFIKAVILGNLQRDRKNPAIVPEEAARFSTGNFSGVPCRERSDELIELVYREYVSSAAGKKDSGGNLKIIGCGGTFSAEDAYRKIRLGASLVQLITGLIFQGPQLVAEVNHGLTEFLKRDGYRSIAEAVGKGALPK